jgi:hypothetical protein
MNSHRHEQFAAWPVLFAGTLLCLACGCSTFSRDWRHAGRQPVQTNSIAGRWEGRWLSDLNGHNGKLLCLVSRQPDGDFAARFRATYWGVLRFSYRVTLKVERHDDAWHFRGEENLGKLAGGIYRYSGRASATNFYSTYDSKYDRGVFAMRRAAGDGVSPPASASSADVSDD